MSFFRKLHSSARSIQVLVACEDGDYTVAFPLLSLAQKIVDKNVKRGIMPKNRAAHRKSMMALKVNAIRPAASEGLETVAEDAGQCFSSLVAAV